MIAGLGFGFGTHESGVSVLFGNFWFQAGNAVLSAEVAAGCLARHCAVLPGAALTTPVRAVRCRAQPDVTS
jgi:hypothetical protein